MANRLGNKIWKEKSRIGMSRKKTKPKKLFYKAGKRNSCRMNRTISILVYTYCRLSKFTCVFNFRFILLSFKRKNCDEY